MSTQILGIVYVSGLIVVLFFRRAFFSSVIFLELVYASQIVHQYVKPLNYPVVPLCLRGLTPIQWPWVAGCRWFLEALPSCHSEWSVKLWLLIVYWKTPPRKKSQNCTNIITDLLLVLIKLLWKLKSGQQITYQICFKLLNMIVLAIKCYLVRKKFQIF